MLKLKSGKTQRYSEISRALAGKDSGSFESRWEVLVARAEVLF